MNSLKNVFSTVIFGKTGFKTSILKYEWRSALNLYGFVNYTSAATVFIHTCSKVLVKRERQRLYTRGMWNIYKYLYTIDS